MDSWKAKESAGIVHTEEKSPPHKLNAHAVVGKGVCAFRRGDVDMEICRIGCQRHPLGYCGSSGSDVQGSAMAFAGVEVAALAMVVRVLFVCCLP